jgi:AraC-like DNA-binding protein
VPLWTDLDNPSTWSVFANAPDAVFKGALACIGVGEQVGRVDSFRDRALTSHGLVIISAGRGTYTRGDGTQEAFTAPALIWLFPGVEHGYGPDTRGWHEHWLLFSGVGASLHENLGLVRRDRPVVSLDHLPARLPSLFGRLRHELPLINARSQLRTAVLLQDLLEECVAGYPGAGSSNYGTAIVESLELGALEPISVRERARRLGITVATLRAAVRENTGMTPVDFILELRIARARTLLADSRLDVRTVAEAVGYDDPAYFSRLFTSRVGLSPSVFRRQQHRAGTVYV